MHFFSAQSFLPLVAATFSLLASTAQAQTTTTDNLLPTPTSASSSASSAPTGSDLPSLVQELPGCAIPCFDSAAKSAHCTITDFACLCQQGDTLTSFGISFGTCINGGLGGSGPEDPACNFDKLLATATRICTEFNTGNPSQEEVASASAIVASAVQSDAAAASETKDSGAAATVPRSERLGGGSAALGTLVVVAAYAVLAL